MSRKDGVVLFCRLVRIVFFEDVHYHNIVIEPEYEVTWNWETQLWLGRSSTEMYHNSHLYEILLSKIEEAFDYCDMSLHRNADILYY